MGSLFHGQNSQVGSPSLIPESRMNILPDDQSIALSKPLCGQLSKYTNVMKGWQYRWFVLSPSRATIEYYEREEYVKQKARGGISLRGSTIAPSDEDSVTFTIHAVNGEIYRLRADNTKARQLWVSRLMYVAQTSRSRRGSTASAGTNAWYDQSSRQTRTPTPSFSGLEESPALVEVKEYVQEMYTLEELLVDKVDSLPLQGELINALDQDMLLLKACSRATLCCLENCLSILERQHAAVARNSFNKNHLQSGAKVEWILNVKEKAGDGGRSGAESTLASSLEESTKKMAAQGQIGFTQPIPVPAIKYEDEVADTDINEEKDLGEIEKHKTVILHLLSQLKLGMDLTRVVLPTFILEKRSLLEMFADCMAHPDAFLRITDSSTAESRMLHVVEWYLTSFHEGRKGSLAKKPYNPIIGETFHCSWDVQDEHEEGLVNRLIYTAEQVSHHPPVSAFHVTCPHKQISMTGSLWTKSKFMGMSIGVTLVGNLQLSLAQHHEDYVMTVPSAYARSILTYPWVELGDKCTITCRKTGYSASIVFHTKPFYGGKLHRISGEVRNPEGATCTKISGAWNGVMELTSAAGMRPIDTQTLNVHKKRVRPLSKQGDHESRRLWQHVTNALRHNDINTATDHKTLLENKQREEERHRKEKGLSFPTKYFQRMGDISSWSYKGASSSSRAN